MKTRVSSSTSAARVSIGRRVIWQGTLRTPNLNCRLNSVDDAPELERRLLCMVVLIAMGGTDIRDPQEYP